MFHLPTKSLTTTTTTCAIRRTLTLTRKIHTSPPRLSPAPPLGSRPGPPALPKAEQEEFDASVRRAESGQFGDTSAPGVADIKDALRKAAARTVEEGNVQQRQQQPSQQQQQQQQQQQHPDLRKQAPEQFEGDVNPFTGEVGGPKRDPFVAGQGDWQYSGRVTDF